MSERATVWLHLGLHKTGTTFLQRVFLDNRGWLAGQGLLFPETGLVWQRSNPGSPDALSGHTLYRAALRGENAEMAELLVAGLERERAETGARDILISSETLFNLNTPVTPAVVQEVLGPLGEVRPVFYLRRQDHYIDSLYKEILGWANPRVSRGIWSFLANEGAGWADLETRLAPWFEAFAPGTLVFRSYDDARRAPGGLLADFCGVLGLPGLPPERPAEDALVHRSMSPDLVNLVRAVNERDDIDPERKKKIAHDLRADPAWAPEAPLAGTRVIPDDEWQALADRWRDWNDAIARDRISGGAEGFRFLPGEAPPGAYCTQRHTMPEARALSLEVWPVLPTRRPPLPQPARIGVLSLLKETPEQTRAFVRYHLNLGIDLLLLFFDDPDDPMIAELSGHPRLIPVPCTPDHWAHWAGMPVPPDMEVKHRATRKAGQHMLREAGADWIISIDGDELLYGDLRGALDRRPPGAPLVRLLPAESVLHADPPARPVFGSARFKLLPRSTRRDSEALQAEYGDMTDVLRMGFFGHTQGKTLVHRDAGIDFFSQHLPRNTRGGVEPFTTPDAVLLHFVALDYDDWRGRWVRRTTGGVDYGTIDPRRAEQERQVRACLEAGDEAALRALWERWYLFDDGRLDRLEEAGLMMRAEIPDWMFSHPA